MLQQMVEDKGVLIYMTKEIHCTKIVQKKAVSLSPFCVEGGITH
jgi:hypothetical protein